MTTNTTKDDKIREALALLEGEKLICPSCSDCIRFRKGKLIMDLDVKKWLELAHNEMPQLDELKKLYADNKEYLNCTYPNGYTALHAASTYGHLGVMEWLISEGADVNAVAVTGVRKMTPLRSAIVHRKLYGVKMLVANGAHLQTKRELQYTVLHCASRCGYAEIVKYLLAAGAYTNSCSVQFRTPRKLAKDDETRKAFDLFRPSLVQNCLQTLYQAHTNTSQSFSLSKKQLDSLPKHLKHRLAPYIVIPS